MTRTAILTCCLLLLLVPPVPAGGSQDDPSSLDGLAARIQRSLETRDLESYLGLFTPGVRGRERDRIGSFFGALGMESVSLRLAGQVKSPDGESRLFFQAYFQNSFSAVIENWQLSAVLRDGRWEVVDKEETGRLRTLYKIDIPSGPAARARSVAISHRDIRLSFKNPVVFYDNIPDVETALIIVGKGEMTFTPSDAIEKHQMELLYKKDRLEDAVEYAYVRCSNSFFSSNIVIEEDDGPKPVTEAERNKAYSVFARNYPRSYTIETPLGDEILSFLPQGDEAVFEFKARKAGELTYIYYPFSDEEVSLYDRGKDRIVSLYHPDTGERPGEKRMFVSFEEKFDLDAIDVEVGYSPAQAFLTAKARIRLIPEIDVLDSLKFRFNSSLHILKILDEEERELFFTQDKLRNLLYVYLISPPVKGAAASIEVFYRGKISPPVPTTDIISQLSPSQNRIIFEPRFETYFFTQNAYWYPAPTQEDYFIPRVKIVVPPGYNCVAVGQLVESGSLEAMGDVIALEKTGSAVYVFESRRPVKYMAFIIGKFDREREAADPIPIQTFISNEVLSVSRSLFVQAKNVLDFCIRSFGPYPYDKLGIVLRIWPTTGGHSPPSFIVLNEMAWVGERQLPMRLDTPVSLFNWDDYFLAHEIAHQWWGQGVSVVSYRDQWLSEGLAQFASASYLREKHGERAYADILKKFSRWTKKKTHKGPIILGARLSYYDYDAYQAIVYNKAAMALFMLQDLLGKDVFLSGLRQFAEAFMFRPARTENFVRAMEKVSGRDLRDFFRGWFHSHELPVVHTATETEKTESGYLLRVRVTQRGGPFHFPLWIEWRSGEGIQSRMIEVKAPAQDFVFAVDGKPEAVRINPLGAVPGKFS